MMAAESLAVGEGLTMATMKVPASMAVALVNCMTAIGESCF